MKGREEKVLDSSNESRRKDEDKNTDKGYLKDCACLRDCYFEHSVISIRERGSA